jgi:hypothetical protein
MSHQTVRFYCSPWPLVPQAMLVPEGPLVPQAMLVPEGPLVPQAMLVPEGPFVPQAMLLSQASDAFQMVVPPFGSTVVPHTTDVNH